MKAALTTQQFVSCYTTLLPHAHTALLLWVVSNSLGIVAIWKALSTMKGFPKRMREEGLKVLPFKWIIQVYRQFLCLQECSSSKGSYSSVSRLDHTEQMWRGYQLEGDNAAGRYRRKYTSRHSNGLASGLAIWLTWGSRAFALWCL